MKNFKAVESVGPYKAVLIMNKSIFLVITSLRKVVVKISTNEF